MEEYFISMGVSVLLQAIKNPEKKRKMRNIFLKVFKTIKSAFPNDVDFQ